jgi:hypothetical protein
MDKDGCELGLGRFMTHCEHDTFMSLLLSLSLSLLMSVSVLVWLSTSMRDEKKGRKKE